jgi:predicted phage tail component-like protein
MGFRFNGRTIPELRPRHTADEGKQDAGLHQQPRSPSRTRGRVRLRRDHRERKIEISCFIPPGKTDEEFLARKDEIIAWLNPDTGLKDLILDKEPGRVYRARLEGGFSFDKAVRNSCTFDLTFLCPDPYAYAETDETYEFTEPGTYTVSRSLGNADSLPVYSLTAELTSSRKAVITTNGKAPRNKRKASQGRDPRDRLLAHDGEGHGYGREHAPERPPAHRQPGLSGAQPRGEHARDRRGQQHDEGREADEHAGRVHRTGALLMGSGRLWRFNESEPDSDTSLADLLRQGPQRRDQRLERDDRKPAFRTSRTVLPDEHQLPIDREDLHQGDKRRHDLPDARRDDRRRRWFMPTTYSVGNTFCPLFNTRYGPGQPIPLPVAPVRETEDHALRFIRHADSSTSPVTPSFTLEKGHLVFHRMPHQAGCRDRPSTSSAAGAPARYGNPTFSASPGTLNASCTADLIWGMHADSYCTRETSTTGSSTATPASPRTTSPCGSGNPCPRTPPTPTPAWTGSQRKTP